MEHALSVEMEELISRLAATPRGLAFLHLGDPEWVATQLGVHPFVVVEAKECLETPDGRKRLIEKVRQARAAEGGRRPSPLEKLVVPARPTPPHRAGELIRAAEQHENGLTFLVEASPEVVAVTFQVHPDLVFRARDVLKRWKAIKSAAGRQ